MAIQQLSCPHCGGVFQVDTAYAGQQASCPHCQGGVMIPGDAGTLPNQPVDYSAGMAAAPGQYGYAPQQPGAVQPTYPSQFPATPETVSSLSCSVCGGLFQVSSTMAGQQVSCPHCSTVVTVPAAQPAGPAMSPGTPMAPGVAPGPYSPQPMAPAPGSPGPVRPSSPVVPAGSTGPLPTTGPLLQTPSYAPQGPTQPGGPIGPGPGGAGASPVSATPGGSTGAASPVPAPTSGAAGAVPSPGPIPEKPQPARPKTPVPAALKNKAPNSPAPPASKSDFTSNAAAMYPPGFKEKSPAVAPSEKTASSTQATGTERPAAKAPGTEPTRPVKPKEQTKGPSAEPEKKAAEKRPVDKVAGKAETRQSQVSTATPATPAASTTPDAPASSAAEETAGKAAEAMLPPTSVGQSTSEKPSDASAKVESLLPPGADTTATSGNQPLPITPQQIASTTGTEMDAVFRSEAVGIPTDDGGFVRLQEPVKTVDVGGEEVELHRLTPEEKSRRRAFKNIIMAIIGIIILVGLGLFLKSFSK